MLFTYLVLALGAIAVIGYFFGFNELVRARNAVDQTWSNIEVELQRRFDLICNLVEVAKGYAKHERDTLEGIVQLRGNFKQENSLPNAEAGLLASTQMTKALGKIMGLAESYPDLKADTQFRNLQLQLVDTENRIAERRNAYNQTVNFYLTRIKTFPSNIVASLHTFETRSFFDAPDELVNTVPEIKLT